MMNLLMLSAIVLQGYAGYNGDRLQQRMAVPGLARRSSNRRRFGPILKPLPINVTKLLTPMPSTAPSAAPTSTPSMAPSAAPTSTPTMAPSAPVKGRPPIWGGPALLTTGTVKYDVEMCCMSGDDADKTRAPLAKSLGIDGRRVLIKSKTFLFGQLPVKQPTTTRRLLDSRRRQGPKADNGKVGMWAINYRIKTFDNDKIKIIEQLESDSLVESFKDEVKNTTGQTVETFKGEVENLGEARKGLSQGAIACIIIGSLFAVTGITLLVCTRLHK